MAWRSIAMGVAFMLGVADPVLWGVMLGVLILLLGAHLWETIRR